MFFGRGKYFSLESVGQSSWAAAQSTVCSLFPLLATNTLEKSGENAIIVN